MFNWTSIFRMPNEWVAGVVLDAALKGGILLVALWVILRLVLRSAPASIRYTVCVLVASGILFLPLVSTLMPQWEIPCPPIATIGLSGEFSRTMTPDPPASGTEEEEEGLDEETETQTATSSPQPSSVASFPTAPATPAVLPPQAETAVQPSTPPLMSAGKETGPSRDPVNGESSSLSVLQSVPSAEGGQTTLPAAQVARVSWDFRALRDQITSALMGLLGFWALAALFSFSPWVLGLLALYGLLCKSRRVEAGPWFDELAALSRSLGIKTPRLYETPHCLAPMAGGFLRAFIIMPANARTWSSDKIRNVLIHELGHIRRHDDLTYLPVRVVAALHWFNPLAWSLLKMLRFERERACDDFVLSQGIASCDYASHLLEIVKDASVSTHPAMLAAAPMATPRRLEKRILAILDDKINRKGLTMRNLITVTLVTAVATLCLGAATLAETMAEPDSSPRVATTSEVKTVPAPSIALTGNARDEIALYYKAAPQDVRDFILWTESQFGGRNWLAENAFNQMDAAAREKEIQQCVTALAEKPYSRDLCPALASAGVLRDKRLLPGLLKTAAYDQPTNYNCRPKWMAIAALARMGEESAVPVLVPLVDFGNKNVQMWSRAALLRLTGQPFDQDKKAWGAWWNARNKEPKLTEDDLKPWSMATAVPPPPRPTPASHPLPTVAPSAVPSSNLTANAQEEIERYYKAAPKEVTDFILLTERQFRWPAENALDALDAQTREKDVAACLTALDQTPYSRQLCPALYKASILRDKRLLPGLLKTAAYSTPDGRYDCRPKWMAIAALARMGGETQNPPAAASPTAGTGTVAEERLTLDNPEDEKTVRDCRIRLIRIVPGAVPEAELAVQTASKAETQQVNLKQQGARTVGDFEILCEEIKVGGGKAGGSVRLLIRYKQTDAKGATATPGTTNSAGQTCDAVIPVLIPMVDFGNKNVQMWTRAALLRLTGQTFDQDKKAWGAWWNAQNKEPKLTEDDLKPWSMPAANPPAALPGSPAPGSAPASAGYPPAPQPAATPAAGSPAQPTPAAGTPSAGAPVSNPALAALSALSTPGLTANAQEEIDRYYKAAPQEVTDFILLTERQFRWPAENALANMDAQTREKEVLSCVTMLDQIPYGKPLCPALYKASVLRDKRLLPGLLKTATYSTPDGRYNCRPKWMAIAALARMGDESAVPVLIPMVDFANKNVQMWSRAALLRLTGQTFDQDKKAWGAWWNAQNKEPKLTENDLKPWGSA